ncbi:unnamed protein product [Caenorhabditis nigoni]
MVTTILLLFSFLNFISAIVPDCKDGKIVFDPSSPETSFPANFSSPGPVFPANFKCEFQINVPEGWFARVELSLISPNDSQSSAVIFDQLNRSETVFVAESDYFYFIASGGRIQFSTGSDGTKFGFIVSWDTYSPIIFHGGRVNASDTVPFIPIHYSTGSIVISAETKVSATVLRPSNGTLLSHFRGIIFFDGPSYNNTKNLGTGLQLWNGNTQYVSTGNSMTVLILDFYITDTAWIVFQDYELTKGIKSFQGENCDIYNPCGSFTLDATNGPAALQIYTRDDVNFISDLSGSGHLDVYIGTASQNKTNLVTTYHVGETSSSLPQQVFGYFKTFLLTDGKATITFNNTFIYQTLYVSAGSTGFLSTDRYGTYALQNCHAMLLSSPYKSTVKFRWSFSHFDLVGDSWFYVEGVYYNNDGNTYIKNYNASNLPQLNSYEEFIGTSLKVILGNVGYPSKGFLMRYEVEKSSNCIFMFLNFVLIFIVYFD